MNPDLSVCVIVRGDASLELLRTVQEAADPVSVEIIAVVDPANAGLAAEIESRFPEAILFENDSAERYAPAVNRALRLARGRYLGIFDEAVTVEKGCFYRLLRFLDDNPETGIAVPLLTNSKGKPLVNARPLPGVLSFCLHCMGFDSLVPGGPWMGKPSSAAMPGSRERSVQWAGFDAMVVRREAVEEIGYLRAGFDRAYADAEYCLRALRHGWHVYQVPGAEATLHGGKKVGADGITAAGTFLYLVARWFSLRRRV